MRYIIPDKIQSKTKFSLGQIQSEKKSAKNIFLWGGKNFSEKKLSQMLSHKVSCLGQIDAYHH